MDSSVHREEGYRQDRAAEGASAVGADAEGRMPGGRICQTELERTSVSLAADRFGAEPDIVCRG